jgi:hypothetical protein
MSETIIQLDRQRATGAQPYSASTGLNGASLTTGDEPMIIDLLLPQTVGKHWIVEQLSLRARLTLRGPSTAGGYPPCSGLFLCPPGTPGESLTEAQAGIVLAARPLMLPMGVPGANVATVGASFAWALQLAAGFKCTVPYGWFLRAIVSCMQGTATPGPGAGSSGILTALAVLEDDNVEAPAAERVC